MNFWDIFKNKDKNIEDDIKIKEEEIKKMEKNEKKDKNGKIPVVTFSNKINNLISALKSDKDLVVNPEEEEKNLFVKFGVNLSKKDEEGRNIIHKYSLLQKKDILKSLIEKVQNIFVINEQDDYGNTPLLLACKRNYKFFNSTDNTRKNVLEILLKAGAKLNVFAKKNLWTPVHWLCINGDLESLELLTQYNALLFTPDYKGFFPIDLAGYKNHGPMVEFLTREFIKLVQKVRKYKVLINKSSPGSFNQYCFPLHKLSISEKDEIELIIEITRHIPKIFLDIYLKLMINNCLYWICYLNLDKSLINRLIDLGALPKGNIYSCNLETPIHGAFASGNFIGLKLLLNRIDLNTDMRLDSEENKNQTDRNNNYQTHFKDIQIYLPKDSWFKDLHNDFKSYLRDNLRNIFYPAFIEKEFLELTDKFNSNPLHLACNNGKYEMLQNIENLNVVSNLDKYLNAVNDFGISPYCLIRDKENTNEFLKKTNKKIYLNPHVVIELNYKPELRVYLKSSINTILNFLLDEKLKVFLMESQDSQKLIVLIDISEEDFRKDAERAEMKFKLLNQNMQKKFDNKPEFINTIEPFYSRHYQQIIYQKISTVLDLNILMEQDILINLYFNHKMNSVLNLERSFLSRSNHIPAPFKFFKKMFFEGSWIIYSEIDGIYRYFGEKLAIFYAFQCFLCNEYLIISILGLIWSMIYSSKLFQSKFIFPIWGLIFCIWCMIMIMRWKRKNREIIHKWGITDIGDVRTPRSKYIGDEYYTELNGKLEKHSVSSKNVFIFLISIPIIIGLLISVVIIFRIADLMQVNPFFTKGFWVFIPSLVKSVSINIISFLYNFLAFYFVENENHKYQETYDNSLIVKVFAFRMVMNLTAVCITTFVEQNLDQVKLIIYNIIIIKGISDAVSRFFVPGAQYYYMKYKFYLNVKNFMNILGLNKSNNQNSIQKCSTVKTFQIENEKIVEKNDQIHEQIEQIPEKLSFLSDLKFKEYVKYNQTTASLSKEETKIAKNETLEKIKEVYKVKDREIKESNLLLDKKETRIEKGKQDEENWTTTKVKFINCSNYHDIPDISPDSIELGSILSDKENLVYYYADTIVSFTIVTLFSCIIPLGPLILLITTSININLIFYADLYFFKKSPPEVSKSIGLWAGLIEFIIIIAIAFNSALLYFATKNMFNEYIGVIKNNNDPDYSEISVGQKDGALFVIAIVEHFIIGLLYVVKFVIPSVPEWIIEETESMMKLIDDDLKDKQMLKNKKEQGLNILEKLTKEIKKKDDEINLYLSKNKDAEALKEKLLREIGQKGEIIKKLSVDNVNEKKEFIKNFKSEKSGKKVKLEFEIDSNFDIIFKEIIKENKVVLRDDVELLNEKVKIAILINFFKASFERIEKEIITKKLNLLIRNLKDAIILCELCSKVCIEIYCFECKEFFCSNCNIHIQNDLWKKHKLINVDLSIVKNSDKKSHRPVDSLNEGTMGKSLKNKDFLKKKLKTLKTIIEEDSNANFKDDIKSHIKNLQTIIKNKKTSKFATLSPNKELNVNKEDQLVNKTDKQNLKKNFMLNLAKKINLKDREHFFDDFLMENNLDTWEWSRLQSFNFPITNSNSLSYEHLEEMCEYLKKEYIYKNGISELNRIDFIDYIEKCINYQKKTLTDNLVNNEDEEYTSKEGENKLKKVEELETMLDSFNFNYEELFLINRIYYSEVKKYGGHLLPSKIHDKLKIIQNGSTNAKIELLISLIDVYSTGVILKSELDKFLTGMCVQNLKSSREISKYSDLAFHNLRYANADELYNRWTEDITLQSFFSSLLSPNCILKKESNLSSNPN